MQAFAGERVKETCCVADEEPAGSCTAGDAMPERPRAGNGIERGATATERRIFGRRRDAGDDAGGDRTCPIAGQLPPPRSPEDDPDGHAAARDRRDADIAVPKDAHPRVSET